MGIPEDIALFEKNLQDLIIRYEHYFLGLEKKAPVKLLEDVEKLSRKYTANVIGNSMLTFKYNSLKARLTSYKQHWMRITRLMEEGKYSRDRLKTEIQTKASSPPPDEGQPEKDEEFESIFQQFLQARRECNLPVDNITREAVAEIIRKHTLAARSRYGCSDVELRITAENGNPKLKIRPKK